LGRGKRLLAPRAALDRPGERDLAERDFGPSPGARVLVNQVEIYFSILQRKAISPADLDHLAERVLAFHERYNTAAEPCDWNLPARRP